MHLSSLLDWTYLRARLFLLAGQLRPEWVDLPPHGHRVRIDPSDVRALRMMAWGTFRGKYFRNRDFWDRACCVVEPDWAIDVGVNYGECLFLPIYAGQTRVLGIEANPGLQPLLEESLAGHPCAQQIRLVFAAAAAESGHQLPFFVDELWSGRSAATEAITPRLGRVGREIQVETVRIDELLQTQDAPKNPKIVFKIDVEGYERHVMSGMWQSIDASSLALGFVEFDPQLLANASVVASRFAEELHERFDVWYFSGPKTIVRSNLRNLLGAIRDAGQGQRLHTDLLLSRNVPSDMLHQLFCSWELGSRKVA